MISLAFCFCHAHIFFRECLQTCNIYTIQELLNIAQTWGPRQPDQECGLEKRLNTKKPLKANVLILIWNPYEELETIFGHGQSHKACKL